MQVKRSSSSDSEAVKPFDKLRRALLANPPRERPRARRRAPFSTRCRDMGPNRSAINTIVATISYYFGQCNRNGLPDPSLAPASRLSCRLGGTSRHGVPQRSRQIMTLILDRFCSGRRPRPLFAAAIVSKSFKTSHSASLKSPRIKLSSKRQL